jgi:hypothetical protein
VFRKRVVNECYHSAPKNTRREREREREREHRRCEIYAFWHPILKYLQKHRELSSLSLFVWKNKKKFVLLLRVWFQTDDDKLSLLYPFTTRKC